MSNRTQKILAVIVVLNALTTAWLVKVNLDQSSQIKALQRDDKVTQSVQKLNTKVDSLKSRVEGLFH